MAGRSQTIERRTAPTGVQKRQNLEASKYSIFSLTFGAQEAFLNFVRGTLVDIVLLSTTQNAVEFCETVPGVSFVIRWSQQERP